MWMEFGDGDSYVTVGIGLRAHRHVDRVTRWHFVSDGRSAWTSPCWTPTTGR